MRHGLGDDEDEFIMEEVFRAPAPPVDPVRRVVNENGMVSYFDATGRCLGWFNQRTDEIIRSWGEQKLKP